MDLAQYFVVATILKGSAQRTSVLQILESDCPVPSKPKVEEQKVLSDYLGSGATEIERKRIFDGAKIMEFKNEVLREETLRTPDHPADANWSETKLICSTRLRIHLTWLGEYLRPEVLMDTTLGILKSHFNLGVANGATKPPEAASTWILGEVLKAVPKTRVTGKIYGTAIPVCFSYSSNSSDILLTGS